MPSWTPRWPGWTRTPGRPRRNSPGQATSREPERVVPIERSTPEGIDMSENVIAVSFAGNSAAYEAFINLKELCGQGQVSVERRDNRTR